MSYCRFGPFSDIYCYYSVDDEYVIHVANMKYKDTSDCPEFDYDYKKYREYMDWCIKAEKVKIGLECDGETFITETPKCCVDVLTKLKNMGYLVPDGVIEDILTEGL